MRKIIIFCLSFVFLTSCKSGNEKTDGDAVVSSDLRVIRGKIVDSKRKSLGYVAIKLYLDENDCMNAYSDNEGLFEFKLDELRVKDQSHFEIVYQGYATKLLSVRNFENDKSIILSKKGDVVSVTDYRVFYESIKSCSRK
ncbi:MULTISPECIES: hypothetical protein [Aquimarina]|nr:MULTISPECIES: hypothetical protein [Aquimarina]